MVAHKIEGLSNGKDQVKGGDGIFLGNYRKNLFFILDSVFKCQIVFKALQRKLDYYLDNLSSILAGLKLRNYCIGPVVSKWPVL